MLLEMKLPPKWILFVAVATVCVITTYVGVMRKPASDIQHQAETIPATFHKIAPSVLSVPCLQKTQHSPPEGGATRLARLEDLPDVQVKSVSCKKLFGGDSDEQTRAKKYHSDHPKVMVTAAQYIKMTASCTAFTQQRKYLMHAVSPEERNFSLAYSILMFKDVEQTERLLRAIYQPQNYYCIHVDAVSPKEIHEAMTAIAGCFSNVFISSRSIHVQWATYSVLEPELVCMRDLWCYPHWRYFINLTGQEWPLKTNGDLVKILTAYNGGNDVEGSVKRSDPERYKFSYSDLTSGEPKAPLKLDVTLTKGSVHIAVQRGFVDFVLHNPISAKFQEWVCDTWIPDETFFSSLNHSPQLKVPGAYLGNPETHPLMKPFLARFKNWGTWPFNFPCEGRWVKQICVLGVGDLPLLYKRKEMFANKFYLDFEPLALDCMEELHWKKVRGEISGTHQFDTSYYAHLSFAKYHLK